MKKIFLTIILIALVENYSYSQEEKSFVIISFERKRAFNHKKKEVETFYWIIPSDSTHTRGLHLFPLYLSGFSNTDFIKCSKGDTINPYLITDETNYDFDVGYNQQISFLINLISNNQIKVQNIIKKWDGKSKESINIYATPIKGKFISCSLESFDLIDYKGYVFLPQSDFSYYKEYWNSTNAKNVKYADYSFFYFINNSIGGSLKKIPSWRNP